MKINDLLQEIEDILDSAGGFPLTGKVIVDPDEISEILREIKNELPEEIQQAQWIKKERQRILDDANAEYSRLVEAAREKADQLLETDEITIRAKKRADDIMKATEENVTNLKKGTYEYLDEVFSSFQKRLNEMNVNYGQKMYEEMSTMFQKMDMTIGQNRAEIEALSQKLNAGSDSAKEEVPVFLEESESAEPDDAEILTLSGEPAEEE